MMNGKKTYIVGIGAILTAVGAYMSGNLELVDAIQAVITAAMGMFIRHGVKTGA